MGVGKERLSGFQNFESFDPAEWTAQGYAVVNVDARGIFDSEGVIRSVFWLLFVLLHLLVALPSVLYDSSYTDQASSLEDGMGLLKAEMVMTPSSFLVNCLGAMATWR